jgi:photosystem II stability/assembly factor-like uncharacterized protein
MITNNEMSGPGQKDAVYALAASPNFANDGLCFAARSTGLYRSEDGGLTWQNAYASLELVTALATTTVALSPDFETDRTVFAGALGGVLRSVDGGHTWYIASLPSPPPFVLTLVVSPNFARDGVILAGTMEDGVFRSADRGATWAAWNFGLLDLNVLCMVISPDFAHDETLFVGTDSGIFRSTNGGRAWREIDFPLDLAPVLSLAISPDYATDGILFAGTELNGLFRSDDRGQTWTPVGQNVITGPVNCILLSPDFPDKADISVVAGDTWLQSRNLGQSWTDWPVDFAVEEEITAVIAPQGLDSGAPVLVSLADGRILTL